MRSATIQERLKLMNIDQKHPKDNTNLNINKIIKEKQIQTIKEEKTEEKVEIEDNQNTKKSNSIHHRATVFSKGSYSSKKNEILHPIQ